MKNEKCDCGAEPLEEHGCPYAEDVCGDYDKKCVCCEECIKECCAAI